MSWDEKFKLDRHYVESLSFRTDMKILMKTCVKVFKVADVDSSNADTMEAFVENPKHTEMDEKKKLPDRNPD